MSVTLRTNFGDMKAELYVDETPNACKNFLALAAAGDYDGTLFHRLIAGFMVQGGDPSGSGKGGRNFQDGFQKNEFTEKLRFERKGVLAFAGSSDDGIGSQFFITFSRQPSLDGKYTIFGRLIDGLDVLSAIEVVPVGKKNRPEKDIRIESIKIHSNPIAETECLAESVSAGEPHDGQA